MGARDSPAEIHKNYIIFVVGEKNRKNTLSFLWLKMGLNSSTMLQDEDIDQIKKETGFSEKQIKRLYVRFLHLDTRGNGTLSREDFTRIPELAINPLNERIIDSFYFECDNDDDGCNFRDFMKTLAHFRQFNKKGENPLNSTDAKLQFIFNIYDVDQDGNINKTDLLKILKMMVGKNIGDEQLAMIAGRTIKDADADIDETIDFDEFKMVMENEEIQTKMTVRFLN